MPCDVCRHWIPDVCPECGQVPTTGRSKSDRPNISNRPKERTPEEMNWLSEIRAVVDEHIALWEDSEDGPQGDHARYLMKELRRLHAALEEGEPDEQCGETKMPSGGAATVAGAEEHHRQKMQEARGEGREALPRAPEGGTVMDPNANLEEQLEIVRHILDQDEETIDMGDAVRLAELVLALSGWIQTGGFLPHLWQRERGT